MSRSNLIAFAVGLAAVIALAACGAGPTPTPTSGIQGQILLGPTCPVQRADQPCPDKPYQATVIVHDAGSGREVRRFTSDADGRFRVPLAPGSYHLVPQSPQGTVFPRGVPADVAVPAGQFVEVTIHYDTGIR